MQTQTKKTKLSKQEVVLEMIKLHEQIRKDRISFYEYCKSIGIFKAIPPDAIRGKEKIAKDA